MRLNTYFGYKKHEGFTAITVPYLGGDLQCLILLPDRKDGLSTLVKNLTPGLIRNCATLDTHEIILYLPKFRIGDATLPLSAMLQTLGMKTAFDLPRGSANLDRMAQCKPDEYLAISEIFHKTFLALDEEGTEAAAATAVVIKRGTGASLHYVPPPEVHVDHPFLFAIQERTSGACLFIGCVNDPR